MKTYRILTVILIIAMIPIFSSCGKEKEEAEEKISEVVEIPKEIADENKIKTITVKTEPVYTTYNTIGEIKKDEDKFYTISSMVQGRIVSSPVKLGDYVKEGQIVAYIENPEIAQINARTLSTLHENRIAIEQAKTKYNLAQQNYERENKLYKEGISPKKDLLQAESDLIIAKGDLENSREREIHIRQEAEAVMKSYGVKPNFDTERVATASPITAMKSGIITKKNVTLGAIVTPEQILFEVTDLDKLWLDIVLYPEDIQKVKKGQKIEFKPDSIKGKVYEGNIDYIQPISNRETQTYTARAFFDNKDRDLQPGMFGEVKIISEKAENKPYIPEQAIQKYGKEIFVFIDTGNGTYKKQLVEIGEKAEGGYYINSGLKEGDKIVSEGSFTLKSEMLKSEFAEED